jgi:hypothetical protein
LAKPKKYWIRLLTWLISLLNWAVSSASLLIFPSLSCALFFNILKPFAASKVFYFKFSAASAAIFIPSDFFKSIFCYNSSPALEVSCIVAFIYSNAVILSWAVFLVASEYIGVPSSLCFNKTYYLAIASSNSLIAPYISPSLKS